MGNNSELQKLIESNIAKLEFHDCIGEKEQVTERTFVMIKPDAFQRGLVGEVLDLVSQRGLKLIALKTVQLTPDDCEKHYSHHIGKNFYPQLVDFMTSGPSMAVILEGNQACQLIRQLIGNSKHPSQVQPGSIRGRYAMDFPRNLIHGSDTFDDARRESSIYLDPVDIFDESTIYSLREEHARRHEELLKEIQRKIKEGINLGDEAFSPAVLKVGDWVYFSKGMSYITKISAYPANKNLMYIYHKDYFGGSKWGKLNKSYWANNQAYESSLEYSWSGEAIYLVGRDDKYLTGFKSNPIMNYDTGKYYLFKDGKWLPIFDKKLKTPPTSTVTVPWAKTISVANGIRITDVYDPRNCNIVRVMANLKSTPKWTLLLGNGDTLPLDTISNQVAKTELTFRSAQTPGMISILIHMGKPYLTSYGDGVNYPLYH